MMLPILLLFKTRLVPGSKRKEPFSQSQVNLAVPIWSSPKAVIRLYIVFKMTVFCQPPHHLVIFSSPFHNSLCSLLLYFSCSASFKVSSEFAYFATQQRLSQTIPLSPVWLQAQFQITVSWGWNMYVEKFYVEHLLYKWRCFFNKHLIFVWSK